MIKKFIENCLEAISDFIIPLIILWSLLLLVPICLLISILTK